MNVVITRLDFLAYTLYGAPTIKARAKVACLDAASSNPTHNKSQEGLGSHCLTPAWLFFFPKVVISRADRCKEEDVT